MSPWKRSVSLRLDGAGEEKELDHEVLVNRFKLRHTTDLTVQGDSHWITFALAKPLHRLYNERIAAALVAHLHVTLVLARGGDHQPRLGSVVAGWFLDINVLASRAA